MIQPVGFDYIQSKKTEWLPDKSTLQLKLRSYLLSRQPDFGLRKPKSVKHLGFMAKDDLPILA